MPPRKRRAPPTDNNEAKNSARSSRPSKQTKSTATAAAAAAAASTKAPSLSPYPIDKVVRLIEPGPILLVTTGSLKDKTHNIMTIGFHMMMQHEDPPLIGVIIGPWDASYSLLKKHRECVLAVPTVEMATTTVDIGNCSGSDVDKFEKFNLETLPAEKVQAPLVAGIRPDSGGNDNGDVAGAAVLANIECVVEDTKMLSKYAMWVLRVVKAWVHPDQQRRENMKTFHHVGDGTFVIDGEKLNLQERMTKWQEFQD